MSIIIVGVGSADFSGNKLSVIMLRLCFVLLVALIFVHADKSCLLRVSATHIGPYLASPCTKVISIVRCKAYIFLFPVDPLFQAWRR